MSAAPKLDTAPDHFALVRVLNKMRRAGFDVRAAGDALRISPIDRLTDSQRAYLRVHKCGLVGLLNDAEGLQRALQAAGPAGLDWREGTPADWPDDRLLAAGEVLYADGQMVNRHERRYLRQHAPPPPPFVEYRPPDSTPDNPPNNIVPMDREAYEERAAIMEYDAGLPRSEAEQKALALALRSAELQAAGWSPWNATARAESEALPGWEATP